MSLSHILSKGEKLNTIKNIYKPIVIRFWIKNYVNFLGGLGLNHIYIISLQWIAIEKLISDIKVFYSSWWIV